MCRNKTISKFSNSEIDKCRLKNEGIVRIFFKKTSVLWAATLVFLSVLRELSVMATSSDTFSAESHKHITGEWTIVLGRRGKYKNPVLRPKSSKENRIWSPTDDVIDMNRESRLMSKMLKSIQTLENSVFYRSFISQIQKPNFCRHISRMLGSQSAMPMVVYGIGSIESYEHPRMQLSLAILMNQRFNWVGDVEVFDPVLSATESRVLKSLGCTVISVNEEARRRALKSTLFFMPHCEAELYDNLLQANWGSSLLRNVALIGNSFGKYEHEVKFNRSPVVASSSYILAAKSFTHEAVIDTVSDDYFGAFCDLSWHFFTPAYESQL